MNLLGWVPVGCGALLALLVAMSGCGSDKDVKVALLLPENETPRYESVDRPAFEKRVAKLCDGCEVVYRNARGSHSRQRSQAEAVLSQGTEVLVLDPVVPEYARAIVKMAMAQDVPVLDYDSLIPESDVDVFVSFDIVHQGELMAEALAKRLADMGRPQGPVVMINGEPGNPDQPRFEEGAERGFATAGVKIARRDFTPFWEPGEARKEMQLAIDALGSSGFAGVYAETDGIAEGSIAAMEANGIDPVTRPTTGKDATIRGLRRIIDGRQYMTLYKPAKREAATAAEFALALAYGEDAPLEETTDRVGEGGFQVPSVFLEPVVVTEENAGQILATRSAEAGR